jgi:hypothetical protein
MKALVITICAVLTCVRSVWAQEPARTDGWVVLPIEEYRALRGRAYPSPPEPVPPPLDAALSRVDYELRLAGDTLTGQARLTIDVLREGWVSLQTPAGVLVRDARLDGRPTRLISASANRSVREAREKPTASGSAPQLDSHTAAASQGASVLISRPGRATLTLDIVVPLTTSAGTESMTLPPCSSALSAVTLVIPRTGVELSVSGGFVTEHTENGGESRWVVYGNPLRPIVFAWKRKVDDRRASLPLRIRGRITELVALAEDTSLVTASVRLDVVQGVTSQIDVGLPDGVVVNQVAGATVSDWTQQAGVLTVSFLEPITADASIVVNAEARAPRDGVVTVPLIRLPAAERESGGVAVDVVGPAEIGDRQPRGLEPADPADLGDVVAGRESPSMVAFQYRPLAGTAPRALALTVSRYSPQAVPVANVEEARYDALIGEDGKTLVRARYAVRNNQRPFLALSLPAQSVLWSASLAGHPARPGVSPAGGFLLPLQKGRSGGESPAFVVEVVYLQRASAWRDDGQAHIDLPAVDLPVSRTGLTLHYSPRFRVEPRPGVFRLEEDSGPWSVALRTGSLSSTVSAQAPPPPSAPFKDFKALVDKVQKEAGRTRQGSIPIEVGFPDFGPAVFLAAELTAEAQGPSVDIAYKKRGER